MKIIEIYQKLSDILHSYAEQNIKKNEATEKINNLIKISKDHGYNLDISTDILESISNFFDEEENSLSFYGDESDESEDTSYSF